MPLHIFLMPLSGCPPGSPLCPATDLPPFPSALVQVIQVTTICSVVLLFLALALVVLNGLRGWRWSRFSWSAISLVGAGVCLLIANRAQEAWRPFAALSMPSDASYNDWAMRITSATLYDFASTIVRFRGLMILGCLLVVAVATATVAQSVQLVRERNRGRLPTRRLAGVS